MFIKRNALKSLMKRAYKGGGLAVRNDGVGISICGAKWCVYFIHGDMPKEVKGDLISLVGELPEKGEGYTAGKDGNQMEFYGDEIMSPLLVPQEKELEILPITVCDAVGILRDQYGNLVPVSKEYLGLLDISNLAEDEETPEGPYGIASMVEEKFYNAACWQNNMMAFSIGEMRTDNQAVKAMLNALKALKITGEVENEDSTAED